MGEDADARLPVLQCAGEFAVVSLSGGRVEASWWLALREGRRAGAVALLACGLPDAAGTGAQRGGACRRAPDAERAAHVGVPPLAPTGGVRGVMGPMGHVG